MNLANGHPNNESMAQPISTAPKDGQRILLHPAVEVADDWSKGYWSEKNDCWIVGGAPMGFEPTHWTPLPAAPGKPVLSTGVEWPLKARVWHRQSTNDWILEIDGTLGDTNLNIRHSQPLSVPMEEVPSLPSLYENIASPKMDHGAEHGN